MKTFVGQFLPKNNKASMVSGKKFGPTMPKKMGYQVIIEDPSIGKQVFIVYDRAEAQQVIQKAKDLHEEQDA